MLIPTLDHIQAERCRRSLRDFIPQAWPIIEPGVPFMPNWHIDAICEHLEAATVGEIRRLIINIPPRTMKSRTVSVMWPAWVWLTRPETRWLFASYAADLATDLSVDCRAIIESKGGREEGGTLLERVGYSGLLSLIGQDWTLSGDLNLKTRFQNTERGSRLATSVGAKVTGFGGDFIVCLPGSQRITTTAGDLPIGDVVDHRLPVRVLGSSGRWQRIEAYECSPGRPLVEIETEDGAVLRCTEDHHVWVEGRGWCPARDVISSYGTLHMRRLQNAVRPSPGSCREGETRSVLLAGVLRDSRARSSESRMDGGAPVEAMRTLQPGVHGQARGDAAPEVLLACLSGGGTAREVAAGVRDVRLVVHSRAGAQTAVLLNSMRERGASHDDPWQGERPVPARRVGDAVLAGIHQETAAGGSHEGRWPLRDVRCVGGDAPGASHRRVQGLPRAEQPRDDVHLLPPEVAYEGGYQRALDEPVRVVAARRLPAPDAVYNVRVAEDHDYYAEGLLVHNCDDPHNAKDAESDLKRADVLRWWDTAISSRMNNPKTGVRVVIMQRLHEEDLTGHLVAKEAGYTHLCLPMEYEPSHPFVWPDDPRSEEGDLLWPGRIDTPELVQMKGDMGSYAAAGQLQQRPAPAEGGILKTAWWRYYDPGLLTLLDESALTGAPDWQGPHFTALWQSWDTTLKDKTSSDFAVGQLWGAFGPDRYLLRTYRARMGLTETITQILAMSTWAAERFPRLTPRVFVENKANGPEVMAAVRKKIAGVIPVNPSVDKVTRAEAITPQLEGGNVYVPGDRIMTAAGWTPDTVRTPTWVQELITECAGFPNGANDDQVDTLTQALDPRRGHGGGGGKVRGKGGTIMVRDG